jgi:type VII secretion-associated serine protease mycosin
MRVTVEPWAQQALDFSSAWPLAQGQGITVAVVDSGVDYTPQLAGKVDAVDVVGTGYQDCVGHGTAVAAIIAARNLQARGVPFEGVAPRARILSVKVNSQEFGNSPTSGNSNTLAQGIIDAATLGAQVINVSVQTRNTPALSRAVRFALRRGAVIVAAGGNDGPDTGTGPFYPASYPYPGVLSVGAVQSDGSLAPFSDLGSHVAVTAPGVNITSAWPGGFADGTLNGTSFATAFVSGVAALVRSRFPGLSGRAVVARIEVTANGGTGPGTGDGLVNPLEAVTAILPPGAAQSASPSARPQAVSVSRAPPPDRATRTTALAITASALGAAALVALGAVVIGQGRRRRWRAGRARIPSDGGPVADDPSPRAHVPAPPRSPVTDAPQVPVTNAAEPSSANAPRPPVTDAPQPSSANAAQPSVTNGRHAGRRRS